MRVDIDQDDTAAEFVEALRTAVAKETGREVPEVLSWNISEVLDPLLGESWWTWLEPRSHIWANMQPTPGFLNAVDRLQRDGHDVGLLTSKPRWAVPVVWKWLSNYRVPILRVTITTPDDAKSPGQHQNKADASDAEVLVDDKPQNVVDFLTVGRRAILYRRPHNLEWNINQAGIGPWVSRDRAHFQEAWSWQDVLTIIEEWSK